MELTLHVRWQLSVSDLGICHCVICWCITSVLDWQRCEITVMVERHNTPNYLLPWTVICRVDLTQREVCSKLPHCSLPRLSLGCPEAWFDDFSTLIKTLILATSMLFWAPQPVWPWLISDMCCFAIVFSCRMVVFDCYWCYCCGDVANKWTWEMNSSGWIFVDCTWMHLISVRQVKKHVMYLDAFDQCSTGKKTCYMFLWALSG